MIKGEMTTRLAKPLIKHNEIDHRKRGLDHKTKSLDAQIAILSFDFRT